VRTLRALLRMGDPPWSRVAGSVALGALTVVAGVGLMSLAGYLISRAAEHPPVLSLTVAIVAVRAFGIGRPVARYFERLRSHGLAFQVLARMRVACYRRIEPLIPSRSIGSHQGDLLASVVGDVDSMQSLFLRGLSPPVVAAVTGIVVVGLATAFLPVAAFVLAVGLVLGGVAVPAVAAVAGRHSRRQAAIRAELTMELVELLRGAPELVVLGAGDAALERIRRLDRELGRLRRRDALIGGAIEAAASLVKGLTVVGVLLACVHAASNGGLDRTMIAALTLGAMAAFEAVEPLPAAALGLRSTVEAGRRLLSLGADERPPTDPDHPAALPSDATAALERVDFDHAADESWARARWPSSSFGSWIRMGDG
jgi:ATP-binding cassette, subfamily C, bacterial CydC